MSNLEFLLGLLECAFPAYAAWEDFTGKHGQVLQIAQRMGFVSRDPDRHPVPSCPHCGEGVPYRLSDRYLCSRCHSTVDRRHLLLWQLDHEAFLSWLARQLHLRGEVRPIDRQLWQLGTGESDGQRFECFYTRRGPLSDAARNRLQAYRQIVVLYGLYRPTDERRASCAVSLLQLLDLRRSLTVMDRPRLRGGPSERVHFDPASGVLWVGSVRFGEVPIGSREHALLTVLGQQQDTFVPYASIKDYVIRHTGSTDATEQATFAQLIKSRLKRKYVPQIDRLIVPSRKADGYRLRGWI